MKAILMTLLAVALVGGLVGGGLFAYFSDTETSTGNTFTAGTIDIDLSGDIGEIVHGSVYHDFKPCETGYLEFTITNSGQNPADIWKLIYGVVDTGGNISEITLFDLWIENSDPLNHIFDTGDVMLIDELDGMTVANVAGKYIYLGALAKDESVNIVQSFHMVDTGWPQNEYQGNTFSFNEDFFAMQSVGSPPAPTPELGNTPTTIASSTMVFQGELTWHDDDPDYFTGVIPMVIGGGYDVYGQDGATAWFGNDPDKTGSLPPVWTPVIIAGHDGWPTWTPDTPDWYQYSLELTGTTWAVRNNPGATAVDPWYDSVWGPGGKQACGVPMSGAMDWTLGSEYAIETGTGAYLAGTGTPEIPGGAAGQGSCVQAWDMDWSWGSELVPLQYPGFDVTVAFSGVPGEYIVTLTPAAP